MNNPNISSNSVNLSVKNTEFSTALVAATGPIRYRLTNDLMCHLVLTKGECACKYLISALIGIKVKDIKSIKLLNPIDIGRYEFKEIEMDFKVVLNNEEIIDIELQMYKDAYWIKRSLLYLGRAYDSIGSGEPYGNLKSTTFIAITDQNLYTARPEFYARYQLLNVKTLEPYTTIYNINVLNLQYKDIATGEDIDSELPKWADIFMATTWEELKEACTFNEGAKEVAEIMLQVAADRSLRTYLEAHEKYLHSVASLNEQMTSANEQLASTNEQLASANEQMESMKANLAKYFMDNDPRLSSEDAMSMALSILEKKE